MRHDLEDELLRTFHTHDLFPLASQGSVLSTIPLTPVQN